MTDLNSFKWFTKGVCVLLSSRCSCICYHCFLVVRVILDKFSWSAKHMLPFMWVNWFLKVTNIMKQLHHVHSFCSTIAYSIANWVAQLQVQSMDAATCNQAVDSDTKVEQIHHSAKQIECSTATTVCCLTHNLVRIVDCCSVSICWQTSWQLLCNLLKNLLMHQCPTLELPRHGSLCPTKTTPSQSDQLLFCFLCHRKDRSFFQTVSIQATWCRTLLATRCASAAANWMGMILQIDCNQCLQTNLFHERMPMWGEETCVVSRTMPKLTPML